MPDVVKGFHSVTFDPCGEMAPREPPHRKVGSSFPRFLQVPHFLCLGWPFVRQLGYHETIRGE